MEQTVRDTLCTLIRRYGHSLCDDPTHCQGMLNDLLRGEHKREVFVLVSALKAGIADDLLRSGGGLPATLLLGRLRQRLENDLAMAGEAAHWAVETWALALGVIDRPVPTEPPATPPRPADHRWWPLGLLVVLMLGVVAYGVYDNDRIAKLQAREVEAKQVAAEARAAEARAAVEMVNIPAGSFLMGCSEGDNQSPSRRGAGASSHGAAVPHGPLRGHPAAMASGDG